MTRFISAVIIFSCNHDLDDVESAKKLLQVRTESDLIKTQFRNTRKLDRSALGGLILDTKCTEEDSYSSLQLHEQFFPRAHVRKILVQGYMRLFPTGAPDFRIINFKCDERRFILTAAFMFLI